MHCKVDSIMKAIDKIATIITLEVLRSCVSTKRNELFPPPELSLDDVKKRIRGLLSYIEVTPKRKDQMIFYGCARGCRHRYEFATLTNDHIMFDLIQCPSGFTQKGSTQIHKRSVLVPYHQWRNLFA